MASKVLTGVETPAAARDRRVVPEALTTVYRVVLELATGAELNRARDLGLDLITPGHHQIEVPRSTLGALQRNGLRFSVIGGTSRFTLAPELVQDTAAQPLTNAEQSLTAAETGTIALTSGTIDLFIEDNTGTAQGYRLQSASAPSGAEVTSLRYRTRISDNGDGDFWCGDYEIWLFSGDTAFELRVYDNLGGATDGDYDDDSADDADIYLNWRSTSYFNGEDPNQWWGILVHDNLLGDDGEMDYIEFQVDWEVPTTGDSYEPDDEWYDAWSHPHNYTSAFRSIDPEGDTDWITFSLGGPSDVVVETDGPSGDTEIWLYNGSVSQIDYDDDSGDGYFSRITRSALPAGTYYLKVEEYSNTQTIPDYAISLSVSAASLPDLTTSTFRVAGDTVQEGDSFWIEVDIDNTGGATAESSHVRLFLSIDGDYDTTDDYEILPEQAVSSLAAGASTSIRWDFTFPDVLDSTSYIVWPVFALDSRNEVAESNEDNTYKAVDTAYVTVWEPVDLASQDVYFRSETGGGGSIVPDPAPGQAVYAHVDFTVSAESAVAGPAWRIYLDGNPLCQDSNAITAGTYTGWCFDPWTGTSGLHNLHGMVDPDDMTLETNESNNDVYRNYTIGGAPDIRVEPLDLYFSDTALATALTQRDIVVQGGVGAPQLRLKAGIVDLSTREDAVADLASALAESTPGERRHLLLQFRRLLDPSERHELSTRGIRILGYVPENGYWASVPVEDAVPPVTQGGGIHRAWHPPAEFKTSRAAQAGLFPPNARLDDGTVLIHARTFEDVSEDEAVAAFEAIPTVEVQQRVFGRVFAVKTPPGMILALASLDIVEWVEPAPPPDESFNAVSAERIAVDHLQAPPYSLDGGGIDVGIWDGGSVDAHPDFGTRLSLHDAGSTISQHSTHVAGTVGGSGTGDPSATGMAPAARLHSWDFDDDELEIRNEGPTAGIELSNHSYGTPTGWDLVNGAWLDRGNEGFGSYSSHTAEWDDLVVDTGLLMFKAAGNDRNDGPDYPDGPEMDGPYDCIPHKGNAKNIITVCATEDDDTMTAFSSWGPTNDGRVKPDLCANGANLWSTVPGGTYDSESGTSMASPSAAGAGALLFDLFRAQNATDPQAHLLKALLIHGARDLGRTGPDYEHGWGLIDAEASAQLIEGGDWSLATLASTGDIATWTFSVPSGTAQIRATAVWTDPQGSPNTAEALVNDLDLTLVAPGGAVWQPWVLDGANPSANATTGVNRVDNVEQVVVQSPVSGEWTVRIEGAAVALGPQEVAVVAEGLGPSEPPPGTESFTVYNEGSGALEVTSIQLEQAGDWISWAPSSSFIVEPGQQQRVDVSVDFAIAPEGTSTRRLLVQSNDPDESPYPGGVDVHVEKVSCYTLTRARTGEGTVPSATPTASANCPSGSYVAGEVVTLTASPAAGWVVGSWSGTDDDASTALQNSATMPASSHTVSVAYVEETSCSPVSLSAQTVNDSRSYEACEELSAGDGFSVISPGDVSFRSGKIVILRDGFSVGSGAKFKAEIDPALDKSNDATADEGEREK